MSIYDYGGIYDYLEDIHFPSRGAPTKFVSKPWFFYLVPQQPKAFSFLGGTWGTGWGNRTIRSVIKILAVDGQPQIPLLPVGAASVEAAADRVWQTLDAGIPRAPEFFGRFDFADRFFWKLIGRDYPKWATNLHTLPTQRKGDGQHRPIAEYISESVDDFLTRWNDSSSAYNANSDAIPTGPEGGGALQGGTASYNVLQHHDFVIPFPSPNLTFKQLAAVIAKQQAWFGPIPDSAWFPEFFILTQSYSYLYGIGQLDDHEWDMSRWPPRRSSLPQDKGGSGRPPSAVTGNYNGLDPYQNFPDHQPPVPF